MEWTDGCGGRGGGGKAEEVTGDVGFEPKAFFRSFLILS